MGRHSTQADARAVRRAAGLLTALAFLALPSEARASLLSPELEDKLATFIALFVIFVVPLVLIALFWMVHVLPEKIAHKRHHPQFEGIRTLCLLSLVFGGLLWPLAWLWAYSRPVFYKMVYGTDTLPHGHSRHTPRRRTGPAPDDAARSPGASGSAGAADGTGGGQGESRRAQAKVAAREVA